MEQRRNHGVIRRQIQMTQEIAGFELCPVGRQELFGLPTDSFLRKITNERYGKA